VRFKETSSAAEFDVELDRAGAVIEARIDGAVVSLASQALGDGAMVIEWDGARVGAFAARTGESIAVSLGPQSFIFKLQEVGRRGARHSLATPMLTAPMPGKVLKVMVHEGEEVQTGQPLITMEAMKMETTLAAEGPARVKVVAVAAGQMVDAGALLMELSPLDPAKPGSDR
jgi:acetyl/propionyl-CoA carboxylase alpha subunit